jgi:hypothetical protein
MSLDVDGLWETYHHIAKLNEMGADEKGNEWDQEAYGRPLTGTPYGRSVQERLVPADELCNTGMCFYGWYAALKGVWMNQWGWVRTDYDTRRRDWRASDGSPTEPVASWVNRTAEITVNLGLDAPGNSLSVIRRILVNLTGEDRS